MERASVALNNDREGRSVGRLVRRSAVGPVGIFLTELPSRRPRKSKSHRTPDERELRFRDFGQCKVRLGKPLTTAANQNQRPLNTHTHTFFFLLVSAAAFWSIFLKNSKPANYARFASSPTTPTMASVWKAFLFFLSLPPPTPLPQSYTKSKQFTLPKRECNSDRSI